MPTARFVSVFQTVQQLERRLTDGQTERKTGPILLPRLLMREVKNNHFYTELSLDYVTSVDLWSDKIVIE